MTNSEKYNGWTNYATWRVNLELFDGYDMQHEKVTPNYIQGIAEDHIEFSSEPGIARDYAMAFLNDVNWYEIAQHLNEKVE
jgi:hypothetical protein